MDRQLQTSLLLTEIDRRIDDISQAQHELARQKEILIQARTELRTARVSAVVRAEIVAAIDARLGRVGNDQDGRGQRPSIGDPQTPAVTAVA